NSVAKFNGLYRQIAFNNTYSELDGPRASVAGDSLSVFVDFDLVSAVDINGIYSNMHKTKYFADFTCFDAQNARTLHVSMEKNTVVLQLKIQAYETQP
ncbi:MAG: hypothetical protein KJ754_05345, partial [Bacteroidetes bacterium]|nr:hypothetical protein [Bacteroidota bacterium]MBU1578832.1 hypothetical protein [Bacteroidota bacterium]